jgi:hypothetical protein
MKVETENTDFLPRNETARLAVERARQTVRNNNEMISRIKEESNIIDSNVDSNPTYWTEYFSFEDSYTADLYKIKASTGIKELIKDMFGVH